MAWPYPDSEGSFIAHLPMPTKGAEIGLSAEHRDWAQLCTVNKRHEEPVPEGD